MLPSNHPGYKKVRWRNLDILQCVQCAYDTPDPARMATHRRQAHGSENLEVPDYAVPLEDWVIQERQQESWCKGLRVALGFLTWNQRDAHVLAMEALLAERDRLRTFGIEATICWVDNGSTDATAGDVHAILSDPYIAMRETINQGSSVARNEIIEMALGLEADYLLFLDGDIEVVPYSIYAMLKTLHSAPRQIASIGLEPSNCGPDYDDQTAHDCRAIYPWMLTKDGTTAWTQYGMWRMEALAQVRFPTDGPFGPGWGLEDDDLFMQLAVLGYEQYCCSYFRYVHRRLHSSILSLGKQEAIANFAARQRNLVEKWGPRKDNKQIAACLNRISGMRIDGMVAAL